MYSEIEEGAAVLLATLICMKINGVRLFNYSFGLTVNYLNALLTDLKTEVS